MRLPPLVLALTPGDVEADEANRGAAEALLARVEAALAAGLTGLLLREPRLDERAFLELARELRGALDARGGWLGVHDRVHLAALAGADGVHLGFRSLAPRAARAVAARFGATPTVGLSAHARDEAAAWDEADYLFLGPVHDTPSKRDLVPPLGMPGLKTQIERAAGRPVWALGGLHPGDVSGCLRAGARGVAVLRGILGAPDPADATARFLAAAEGRAR